MTGAWLIRQGRIVDPTQGWDQVGDVWIEGGQIHRVGFPLTEVPTGIPVWEGRGWVVGPGLVDLYAHSGTPGFEGRETIRSLATAALAGGFTRVGILPSTDPPLDHAGGMAVWQHPYPFPTPHWLPWGAYSQGSRLGPLLELAAAGVVGFAEGQPLPELGFVRRLLDYAQVTAKPLLLWPRWESLAQGGVMQEGPWSRRLGLPGIPSSAETVAVAALLELATATQTPLHLMRLSQARSLELISGSRLTASTTWMHLLLTDGDIGRCNYDASLRLDPPLGTESDRAALRGAVAAGRLVIATDHHAYTWEEKLVGFEAAPPGAVGLELALPLLWQHLVVPGILSPLALWSALSTQPAQILGLEPPSLQPGSRAEVVVLDPERPWQVNHLYTLGQNTPWWGEQVRGQVLATWCGEQVWFRD
ncbi:MAG: dihydroorotase [Thermostichales cyanobacterium SZTDM-1c_bins_54]